MPESRVFFVNRVYWPAEAATARLLTDLAEALAARGWEVHVIAAGAGPDANRGVTIHRTGGSERHGGLVSRTLNFRRFLAAARRELAGHVRPGDVVVLMTDPPTLAAAGTGPARSRGARVVQWIHDIYPEIVAAHAGAWLAPALWPLRRARNRAWRAADLCVALDADMVGTVRDQGVRAEASLVLPNWAPPELDAPAGAEAVAAQRRDWELEGRFVAAYFGNLGRVHEFSCLLAAAQLLRDEPGLVFLFAGEGARYNEVRAAVEARRLGNVRFLPAQPRDRLAAALAAADVHFVTLRPGFERLVSPSKLAGVLAAARPVLFVGPGRSGLAALLAREECGLSLAPSEAGGLAAAIRTLRGDPARRQALGRAARGCYERHFTFAAAVARWDGLLRGVAGRR